MKSLLLKTTLMLALIGSMSACSSNNTSEIDKSGKEYTSAYVCPMHCEGSGSDTAGTCPTCGMDYVKNNK
ncbi:MAG: hypothetical protein ACI9GO_000805 [Bacteroidia bacterium]|jgi:hypothetical protein